MAVLDHGVVSNRTKIRSVIVAIIIHLAVISITTGIVLLIAIPSWIAAYVISGRELAAIANEAFHFKKSYPFRYFGSSFGEFTHVFCHGQDLEERTLATIDRALKAQVPVSPLKAITITDIDGELRDPEERTFRVSTAGTTSRGTTVTLLLRYARFGQLQSVQWWVLAGGYVDRDKKFNFVAYAPLTIWFWLIPYLRRDHDIVPRLRSLYSSTYNYLDVETQVKGFHEVVFNALIEELEHNGIDTSELKVQRMQVMNISISGGQVQMGNVVQGAMNRVVNSAKGAGK
ncbi:hypothetical protein [Sphingomonas solaris]|uniref:Uncharacterized protein n=1 Tax=Alterirhizorhabdus solaris TaxID=2529389 RepID=A0A558RCR9_9SPHN|nr:hypothetical protein [Sphingomonas solaris]TVV77239.1 hypothetical protein FOY91_01505 [Sphingomonas solaris]